ncbi:MAG: L,D-transpeptidase, partial [Ensifer sp. SSB1]|nr:L,D-transpeptidase [Ensifer sp. SSB1]
MTGHSEDNGFDHVGQPVWTRRKLGVAVLAAALALGPLAAWAQTQIYDARTKKWVNYD